MAQLVEQLIRNQQVRGSSPLSSFFDGGKLSKIVEAWLSLVERCVRDAEVASSNLVASMIRPIGQAVKTPPSHGGNPGSIPG